MTFSLQTGLGKFYSEQKNYKGEVYNWMNLIQGLVYCLHGHSVVCDDLWHLCFLTYSHIYEQNLITEIISVAWPVGV